MWIGTEANALQALGRASEAAAQFRRTLQLDGGYQPAYANLGLALSGMEAGTLHSWRAICGAGGRSTSWRPWLMATANIRTA